MKVAIVHDWLVTDAGAEKVLRAIIELYPDADVYSLVDFLSDEERRIVLTGKKVTTSFIQKLPFARKYFRHYLPLFPLAIESFDLSGYDLVISSSWAVAKGVKADKKQLHVCYCHTPIRYAWDLFDEYTHNLPQPKKWVVQQTLRYLRTWDQTSAKRVDCFVANSHYVAERIFRHYGRDAEVIHPPVDTDAFVGRNEKEAFYLTASRLVPYKKVSMIVSAFNESGRQLVVIGEGEEYKTIQRMAKPNVTLLGWQERSVLVAHMQRARGFVYAALEDFGIVPVEAMACGTPVIAYGAGGVLESVKNEKTGVLFDAQNSDSLNQAVDRFERMTFDADAISSHAAAFGRECFKQQMQQCIEKCLQQFRKR